jgi:hypothetical protein
MSTIVRLTLIIHPNESKWTYYIPYATYLCYLKRDRGCGLYQGCGGVQGYIPVYRLPQQELRCHFLMRYLSGFATLFHIQTDRTRPGGERSV